MSQLICPKCDINIEWRFIKDENIESGTEFNCPHCQVELVFLEDESNSLYEDCVSRIEMVEEV